MEEPNGTIRNILGGTVFRSPIVCKNIPRPVGGWQKPIVVGRHAHADQYKACDVKVNNGSVKLVIEDQDGTRDFPVAQFEGEGVTLGMFNTRASIEGFARSCMSYALQMNYPLYFSTKTRSLRPTMVSSKRSSKKSLIASLPINLKNKVFSMSIVSSTIW